MAGNCPEPRGLGANGEVLGMGFQAFSIWGSHDQAVVQIRPALKWGPPHASEGDGRKEEREKGRLIWPWESQKRADMEESDFQREIWSSGGSTRQGVRDLGSSAWRPLPSSVS